MSNRDINANSPLHFHEKTGGQQVEKTKEKCEKCIFYTFSLSNACRFKNKS